MRSNEFLIGKLPATADIHVQSAGVILQFAMQFLRGGLGWIRFDPVGFGPMSGPRPSSRFFLPLLALISLDFS